jgi:hypothetical protein
MLVVQIDQQPVGTMFQQAKVRCVAHVIADMVPVVKHAGFTPDLALAQAAAAGEIA